MNYRDFKNYYNLDENAQRAVMSFITKVGKNRRNKNKEVDRILSQRTPDVRVSAHPEHPQDTINLARRGVRENYDAYDIVVSHLLDEGYANSVEGAEMIAMNMSENWAYSIVEAQQRLFDAPPTTYRRVVSGNSLALMAPGRRAVERDRQHQERLPKGDPRIKKQRDRARVIGAAYASARNPR